MVRSDRLREVRGKREKLGRRESKAAGVDRGHLCGHQGDIRGISYHTSPGFLYLWILLCLWILYRANMKEYHGVVPKCSRLGLSLDETVDSTYLAFHCIASPRTFEGGYGHGFKAKVVCSVFR